MAPIKRNRLAVAAFVVTVAGAVATGVLLSCNAAQPGVNTLVLTVSERNIDNQGQQSTITVQATDSKGIPGKGQINLSATAGVFITPSTVTLSNGTASADFTCPLATDPNCTGLVDITATWVDKNNLTKTTTLTVGTSVSTRVTLYIVRLSVLVNGNTINGTVKPGSMPPTSPAPIVTVTSAGATIPGGSKQIQISSASSYSRIALGVAGETGYFELTGLTPGSGGALTLLATIAQHAPSDFTIQLTGGDANNYGPIATIPIHLTTVGTGDVQVNVSWDVDNDLDLHVVGPTNVEIYYGNRTDSYGGTLDLDSNAACVIDGKRSENITWPTGRAQHGTYTVKVDYWANCPPAPITTNYVVTVNVTGQDPQVFNGTFNQPTDPDHGGAGSGRTVTTFSY